MAAVFAPKMVNAQDYTVGVRAGDWVKYGQITYTWTGNGTEPSPYSDLKNIDWMRIDVLNVTGTTAGLNWTTHLINGTQTFLILDVDVPSEGGPILAGGRPALSLLIASNLKAGYPIGAGAENTINQTVTRMYAGANRNVNIIYGEYFADLMPLSWKVKFYFDQDTGIVVEEDENMTDSQYPTGYLQFSFKATETNLWSASALDIVQNNLIYIIAGVAVIIVIVAATIVLRRRKSPSIRQPPPPSEPPPSSS